MIRVPLDRQKLLSRFRANVLREGRRCDNFAETLKEQALVRGGNTMKLWIPATLLAMMAISTAAPAMADSSEFFDLLDSQYLRQHYSNQQLLGEAYKVCNYI